MLRSLALSLHARHVALTGLLIGFPTVLASPPVWWSWGNPSVLDPSAPIQNNGVAVVGQAKFMADRALQVLTIIDSDLADDIRADLTQPQPRLTPPFGMLGPVVDFEVPSPKTSTWSEAQHAVLTVGQLKAISAPFYKHIHTAVPTWIDRESANPELKGQLQLNGTKDAADASNFYPWTTATGDDANRAPATVGQLKAVFSLRLETLDLDGDGISDYDPDGDYDGDGISNGDEFALGSNPILFDTDGVGAGEVGQIYMIYKSSFQRTYNPPIERISSGMSIASRWFPYPPGVVLSPSTTIPVGNVGAVTASHVPFPDTPPDSPEVFTDFTGNLGIGYYASCNMIIDEISTVRSVSALERPRLWLELPADMQSEDAQKIPYLFVTSRSDGLYNEWGEYGEQTPNRFFDCSVVEFEFEPGSRLSKPLDIETETVGGALGTFTHCIYTLRSCGVAVDADRDGEITFYGKDKTTVEEPFRFWINDDVDKGGTVDTDDWEEDDYNESAKDSDDQKLNYSRDLEDLARLWIDTGGLFSGYADQAIELKVRIESSTGNPVINLYQPVETDGGREYLKDENVGYNQLQGIYGQELCQVTSESTVVPRRAWETWTFGRTHFLFEGVQEGEGQIIFELWNDGTKMVDFPPVHICLKKAKDMYETWSVGDVASAGVDFTSWPTASATQTSGQNLPAPEKPEEKDYIMFVHGWNMPGWEKEAFASTMFKRMWHQGYKGRFGAFRWPTFHGMSADFDSWSHIHTAHFDGSEQRAWNSAAPLAALTSSLAGTFKDDQGNSLVRFYAHSMGNIVTSEALRRGTHVSTYISAQAALSSHVWDNTTPVMPYPNYTTPNVYGFYWQPGAPPYPYQWQTQNRPSYMAAPYMTTNTTFINHYNPLDWALSFKNWQANQFLKPDAGYSYLIGTLSSDFARNLTILSFPDDRHEIFSYAAQSRGYATGQMGNTGGKFNVADSVNLNSSPYSFGGAHKGHSAQFRSTVQKRWTYWRKALCDMSTQTP